MRRCKLGTAIKVSEQLGFSLEELDQLEEGQVMDCIIESGNDFCADEYCTVADQHAMDVF